MSLPTAGAWPSRRRRATSIPSNSLSGSHRRGSPQPSEDDSQSLIPGTGFGYGSISRHNEPIPILSGTLLSQREPTRSFFHSSFRGTPAPIDSAQNARNVREDTAELASYALSDQASSILSVSPHRRDSNGQAHIESYFQSGFSQDGDSDDLPTPTASGEHRPEIIHEVSEPVSPEGGPASHRSTSAIANMLRRSPPSRSPPDESDDDGEYVPSRRSQSMAEQALHEEAVIDEDQVSPETPPKLVSDADADEITPLLHRKSISHGQIPHDYIHVERDIEAQELNRSHSWPKLKNVTQWPLKKGQRAISAISNPKNWNARAIWQVAVVKPAGFAPAVILGLLLNILDALSYGMILFPLGQPIFEKLGPAGISMFYVSCIISQLVYSCGGSIFKGGIGSEMIEVVPFFHKMAFTIMAKVGEENADAVIATTITAYALSSILTGLVFFLMGMFKFGYIVGFIPRHILIGCIGGVGWFLVATGFEVTARLDGNLNYDLKTLKKMFQSDTVALWTIPFALGILLYLGGKRFSSKYFLPSFILLIPTIFYVSVFSISNLRESFNTGGLRDAGWIFEGPAADEPWWFFFTLYKFDLVDWTAIAETIPAMFALTFFGVLHVPINVPALAFNIGEDNLDLNRELIAHGFSNAISGMFGSIQNYLVYTNSVMFIRSGGNNRFAGIMLAGATFGILLIGPILIGFIPVMMVGTLIFVLGFELFFEAVWDPRRKLKWLEYCTVIVIVLVMGVYDFVVGIFVGIGLAFVSLVVQTSRIPAVRASYSGEVVGSTVRRNQTQHAYLREAGKQVHVTKLAGYLFFGTIVSVEERIRRLIDVEAFNDRPIRYLIFDLWHVTGIDYSAAEAFSRINRVFSKKGVNIVMSGIDANGPIGLSLRNVGLDGENSEVQLFVDLNSALESCENELLKSLYASKEARASRNAPTLNLDMPTKGSQRSMSTNFSHDVQFSSPRQNQLHQVATRTLKDSDYTATPKWQNFKKPLPLILQTFTGLTDKNEDFWFRATKYFVRKEHNEGDILYEAGQEANGFYLLEDGILRAEYNLPQGQYYESIVAGTTCGELPFFSATDRTATVLAERDCVTWMVDREGWEKLQAEEGDVAMELFRIGMKLTSERMNAITSYVLTTAG